MPKIPTIQSTEGVATTVGSASAHASQFNAQARNLQVAAQGLSSLSSSASRLGSDLAYKKAKADAEKAREHKVLTAKEAAKTAAETKTFLEGLDLNADAIRIQHPKGGSSKAVMGVYGNAHNTEGFKALSPEAQASATKILESQSGNLKLSADNFDLKITQKKIAKEEIIRLGKQSIEVTNTWNKVVEEMAGVAEDAAKYGDSSNMTEERIMEAWTSATDGLDDDVLKLVTDKFVIPVKDGTGALNSPMNLLIDKVQEGALKMVEGQMISRQADTLAEGNNRIHSTEGFGPEAEQIMMMGVYIGQVDERVEMGSITRAQGDAEIKAADAESGYNVLLAVAERHPEDYLETSEQFKDIVPVSARNQIEKLAVKSLIDRNKRTRHEGEVALQGWLKEFAANGLPYPPQVAEDIARHFIGDPQGVQEFLEETIITGLDAQFETGIQGASIDEVDIRFSQLEVDSEAAVESGSLLPESRNKLLGDAKVSGDKYLKRLHEDPMVGVMNTPSGREWTVRYDQLRQEVAASENKDYGPIQKHVKSNNEYALKDQIRLGVFGDEVKLLSNEVAEGMAKRAISGLKDINNNGKGDELKEVLNDIRLTNTDKEHQDIVFRQVVEEMGKQGETLFPVRAQIAALANSHDTEAMVDAITNQTEDLSNHGLTDKESVEKLEAKLWGTRGMRRAEAAFKASYGNKGQFVSDWLDALGGFGLHSGAVSKSKESLSVMAEAGEKAAVLDRYVFASNGIGGEVMFNSKRPDGSTITLEDAAVISNMFGDLRAGIIRGGSDESTIAGGQPITGEKLTSDIDRNSFWVMLDGMDGAKLMKPGVTPGFNVPYTKTSFVDGVEVTKEFEITVEQIEEMERQLPGGWVTDEYIFDIWGFDIVTGGRHVDNPVRRRTRGEMKLGKIPLFYPNLKFDIDKITDPFKFLREEDALKNTIKIADKASGTVIKTSQKGLKWIKDQYK